MTAWLIPCSPSIYDAEGAFDEYGKIIWHQNCNMQVGDVAYIYVTAPKKQIRCKCVVSMVDIPEDIGDDEGYTKNEEFCRRAYRRYMELTMTKHYNDCYLLGYEFLLHNGLFGSIRSQRKATPELVNYIEEIDKSI